MGTVNLLPEITIDFSSSSKSIGEKALGVLDNLCDFAEGRAAALLLMKKILMILAAAVGLSESVMRKLEKCEQKAGRRRAAIGALNQNNM
ncbi:hypothetical protein LINGRAHAP2_LOCUS20988 [Linum grandiflorum]